jgi:hypothetical protein
VRIALRRIISRTVPHGRCCVVRCAEATLRGSKTPLPLVKPPVASLALCDPSPTSCSFASSAYSSLGVETSLGRVVLAGQALQSRAEWDGATEPSGSGRPSACGVKKLDRGGEADRLGTRRLSSWVSA